MKLNKLIYTLGGVVALGMTSCAHFLDTPTDSRVELATPEQVRMLMSSAYPNVSYMWPCVIMSDDIEDNNCPDQEGMRYNLASYDRGDDEMFRFDQCVSASHNDSPFGIWEAFYKSVASCNHAIELLDQLQNSPVYKTDKTVIDAVRGEALVLRSYCHFILAQMFCMPYGGVVKSEALTGIPYMEKTETTVKPNYARPTLAYTYEKIVKDFEDGIGLIDNGIYEQPKYHFNTAAAYAYGARLFLFMRKYHKAFNYANMALGASKMDDVTVANTALRTDPTGYLSDTYAKTGQFYYLQDLGYYHNNVDKQPNFLLMANYSVGRRHFSATTRYSKIRSALSSTMRGAAPPWQSFKWSSSSGRGGTFCMHPCFNGCSYINGKADYGLWCGVNVQEFFEYTDKVAKIGYAHTTRREFSGEETLLVRAEASLFLGDTQAALADLDAWERNRRNCPSAVGKEDRFVDLTVDNINRFYVTTVPADRNSVDGFDNGYGIAKEIHIDQICPENDGAVSAASVDGMLQCIQHFRRIELLETGMRWFDIKRFGLEYSHFQGKEAKEYHLGIEDPRKAIQIPPDVVAAGFEPNQAEDRLTREGNTEKVVYYSE